MNFSSIPSFKISIPLLLIVFSILLSLGYLYYTLPQSDQAIEQREKEALYRKLSRIQGSSEYLLQKGDMAGVRREVASLVTEPEYLYVLLANNQQKIVASTQRALLNQNMSEVFAELDSAVAQQTVQHRLSNIVLASDAQTLTGYISVNFGAKQDELRPNHIGLLIIQKDMAPTKAESRAQILDQSLYWVSQVFLLALILGLVFHFLLTRRVGKLVLAAEAFAQGQLNTRSQLSGSDELARLSMAFDEMAGEISSSQNKLATDVKERKLVEANLRDSEASYRALFDANEDSVFIHEPETGAILDVNLTACETYGYSFAEFRQLNVGDISSGVAPYTMEQAAQFICSLEDNKPIRFEWHAKYKDGSLYWNDVCLKKVVIAGQPRVLAFTRDITERKQTEADQLELESQLRQAQKMESIGQLTGGIAHDFNNILTSIIGNADLSQELLSQQQDPKLKKYINNILRSGDRARNLILQMLTFSRGQHSETCTLPLAPLIDETIKLMRPTLPSSMELRTDITATVSPVRTAPVQIEQILMNLYINARDAMNGQGEVKITLKNQHYADTVCSSCRHSFSGDFVELTVKDNGEGISPEIMERIFEPFYTTKDIGKGSGMGLSMVHGIVHEHKGHIILRSKQAKGSTFRMLFPAINDYLNIQSVDIEPLSGKADTIDKVNATVLLVDDEQMVIEFMSDLLQSRGMDVIPMTNSENAFTAFKDAPDAFDLIITDQTMPKMTGLELSKLILNQRPNIPIILYTGHSDRLSEEAVFQCGIKGFQKKPVDIQALITLIRQLLDKG